MIEAPWLNLAIAIGVGLMIGLERERGSVGVDRAWWRSPLFPTPRVTMTILA